MESARAATNDDDTSPGGVVSSGEQLGLAGQVGLLRALDIRCYVNLPICDVGLEGVEGRRRGGVLCMMAVLVRWTTGATNGFKAAHQYRQCRH